jgi:hypothetical protein
MVKNFTKINYFKTCLTITILLNTFFVNAQKAKPVVKKVAQAKVQVPTNNTQATPTRTEAPTPEVQQINVVQSSSKFLPLDILNKFSDFYTKEMRENIVIMNEQYAFDFNDYNQDHLAKMQTILNGYKLEDKIFYPYYLPKITVIDNEENSIQNYATSLRLFLKYHAEVLIFAPDEIVKFYDDKDGNDIELRKKIYMIHNELSKKNK